MALFRRTERKDGVVQNVAENWIWVKMVSHLNAENLYLYFYFHFARREVD